MSNESIALNLVDNYSTDDSLFDMEFYEDLHTSNLTKVSVPHATVGGVEYAVTNGKSHTNFQEQDKENDRESNSQSLPGNLSYWN